MSGIKNSEAQIERAFVRYAESIGVLALKLRIDGMNGWPDRTIIHNGLLMFAEFKVPKGKLRPGQKTWIRLLRELGYKVITPRRIGEAEAELDKLIRRSTQT